MEAETLRRSRFEKAYYGAFLFALVGCFTPFKALAYVLPWLIVGMLVVAAPGLVSRHRLAALFVVGLGLGAFYAAITSDFLYTNYLITALTYSAFVPVFVVDARQLASHALLGRMVRATAVMVGIQGVVGIVQALHGLADSGQWGSSNGDYVQGTIYPFFAAEGLGANPMFAVNMALMLLACLAAPDTLRRSRASLVAGAIALVLASVIHVVIFVVAALVMAYVFVNATNGNRTRRTPARYVLALLVIIVSGTYVIMPNVGERMVAQASTVFELEGAPSPRALMLYAVAVELPHDQPLQPIIGLGPGQFASRACLMMSGLFLGGPGSPKAPPFVEPQATPMAQKYSLAILTSYADDLGYIGSTQQPFFSWLSVYTELGLVGVLAVLTVIGRLLLRWRRRARLVPEYIPLALLLCAGTLFLACLGVQENYWEMPQAILIGLMLLKVMHAILMYGQRESDA